MFTQNILQPPNIKKLREEFKYFIEINFDEHLVYSLIFEKTQSMTLLRCLSKCSNSLTTIPHIKHPAKAGQVT